MYSLIIYFALSLFHFFKLGKLTLLSSFANFVILYLHYDKFILYIEFYLECVDIISNFISLSVFI